MARKLNPPVNRVAFGASNDTNSDWLKLKLNMKDWRSEHPDEDWPMPSEFAKQYQRYKEFDSSTFYHAFQKAKKQIGKFVDGRHY